MANPAATSSPRDAVAPPALFPLPSQLMNPPTGLHAHDLEDDGPTLHPIKGGLGAALGANQLASVDDVMDSRIPGPLLGGGVPGSAHASLPPPPPPPPPPPAQNQTKPNGLRPPPPPPPPPPPMLSAPQTTAQEKPTAAAAAAAAAADAEATGATEAAAGPSSPRRELDSYQTVHNLILERGFLTDATGHCDVNAQSWPPHAPRRITVLCRQRIGSLDMTNDKPVVTDAQTQRQVPPTKFETMAGANSRRWRHSFRVLRELPLTDEDYKKGNQALLREFGLNLDTTSNETGEDTMNTDENAKPIDAVNGAQTPKRSYMNAAQRRTHKCSNVGPDFQVAQLPECRPTPQPEQSNNSNGDDAPPASPQLIRLGGTPALAAAHALRESSGVEIIEAARLPPDALDDAWLLDPSQDDSDYDIDENGEVTDYPVGGRAQRARNRRQLRSAVRRERDQEPPEDVRPASTKRTTAIKDAVASPSTPKGGQQNIKVVLCQPTPKGTKTPGMEVRLIVNGVEFGGTLTPTGRTSEQAKRARPVAAAERQGDPVYAANDTVMYSRYLKEWSEYSGDEVRPDVVEVICNSFIGEINHETAQVMYEGREMPARDFEVIAGRGSTRKWKESFRVHVSNLPGRADERPPTPNLDLAAAIEDAADAERIAKSAEAKLLDDEQDAREDEQVEEQELQEAEEEEEDKIGGKQEQEEEHEHVQEIEEELPPVEDNSDDDMPPLPADDDGGGGGGGDDDDDEKQVGEDVVAVPQQDEENAHSPKTETRVPPSAPVLPVARSSPPSPPPPPPSSPPPAPAPPAPTLAHEVAPLVEDSPAGDNVALDLNVDAANRKRKAASPAPSDNSGSALSASDSDLTRASKLSRGDLVALKRQSLEHRVSEMDSDEISLGDWLQKHSLSASIPQTSSSALAFPSKLPSDLPTEVNVACIWHYGTLDTRSGLIAHGSSELTPRQFAIKAGANISHDVGGRFGWLAKIRVVSG